MTSSHRAPTHRPRPTLRRPRSHATSPRSRDAPPALNPTATHGMPAGASSEGTWCSHTRVLRPRTLSERPDPPRPTRDFSRPPVIHHDARPPLVDSTTALPGRSARASAHATPASAHAPARATARSLMTDEARSTCEPRWCRWMPEPKRAPFEPRQHDARHRSELQRSSTTLQRPLHPSVSGALTASYVAWLPFADGAIGARAPPHPMLHPQAPIPALARTCGTVRGDDPKLQGVLARGMNGLHSDSVGGRLERRSERGWGGLRTAGHSDRVEPAAGSGQVS